ncbi:MAG: hypothetical protein AB9834_13380 [Lentimicrobium sp.]
MTKKSVAKTTKVKNSDGNCLYETFETEKPDLLQTKVDNFPDYNGKKKQNHRRILFIKLLIGLATVCFISVIFVFTLQLFSEDAYYIIAVLVLINFVMLTKISFNEEIDGSVLGAFFTLMLFNISILPIYGIYIQYKDKTERNVTYTFGLRSWAAEVEISDITVTCYDQYDNRYKLTEDEVFKSINWKKKLWIFKPENQSVNDSLIVSHVNEIKKTITLRNCGIVFCHEILESKAKDLKNFYVEATIKFIGKDSAFISEYLLNKSDISYQSYKFYSAQICLRVPVVPGDANSYNNEDYLAYEFFFDDFTMSKLRSPGLGFDFLDETLMKRIDNNDRMADSIAQFIRNKILISNNNRISTNDQIRLSAYINNNASRFNLVKTTNTEVAQLFDFYIPPDKLFNMPTSK